MATPFRITKDTKLGELKDQAILVLKEFEIDAKYEALVTSNEDFIAFRNIFRNIPLALLRDQVDEGWYDSEKRSKWKDLVIARIAAANASGGESKRLRLPVSDSTIAKLNKILASQPGELKMLVEIDDKMVKVPIDHIEIKIKSQRRDKKGNLQTRSVTLKDKDNNETTYDAADYLSFSVTKIEIVE